MKKLRVFVMVIAVLAVVSGQTAHANPNGYTQDELHALQQREKQIPANGSPSADGLQRK